MAAISNRSVVDKVFDGSAAIYFISLNLGCIQLLNIDNGRRLRQMAEIDEKLAELEGFSDYIREYQVTLINNKKTCHSLGFR